MSGDEKRKAELKAETVVSIKKFQRMTINELRRQLDEKQARIEKLEAAIKKTVAIECACGNDEDEICYLHEALGESNEK